MQFDANVENVESVGNAARRLVSELTAAVSGDLGYMLTSMVGLRSVAQGSPGTITESDSTLRIGPLWWAPDVVALCCRAYGRPAERAVPVGACLQLLGVAAGVLDSAQDRETAQMSSHMSSHMSPSSNSDSDCHVTTRTDGATGADTGVNRADQMGVMVAVTLNAAVALIGLLWQALFEYGPRYGIKPSALVEIGRLLANLSIRTCYGQHLDLTARSAAQLPLSNSFHAVSLKLEEYERMASDKSGALGGMVCEAAAILAGAEEHRPLWRKLGTDWMTALQLKDDYIDLEEDLAAGRISLSVLYGLEVADPIQKNSIMSLLEVGRTTGTHAADARRELIALLESMGTAHYIMALLAVLRRRMLATVAALSLAPLEYERLCDFVLSIAPEYGG